MTPPITAVIQGAAGQAGRSPGCEPVLWGRDAMLSMPEHAAAEHACYDARAEQARDGAWSGAAAYRDVRADHRRGRHRRRALDLVLPCCGRPGGEEQQELGHGED